MYAFPVLRPNEFLLSGFARCYDDSGYRHPRKIAKELLGSEYANSLVELPSRIDGLTKTLGALYGYSSREIIYKHTLYPYFRSFIPRERSRILEEAMRADTGGTNNTAKLAGLHKATYLADYLNYCPDCVKEDHLLYGHSYWHREHQIPGVKVCPKHLVFLEVSNVYVRGAFNPVSAEQTELLPHARPLDSNSPFDKYLLKIAQASIWLLEHNGTEVESIDLFQTYRFLLAKAGLAVPTGTQINHDKLKRAVSSFFPEGFLEAVQCNLSEDIQPSWTYNLFARPRSIHPVLHHILLILSLGYELKKFFKELSVSSKRETPFGNGPWPCLNKASDHYSQLRIMKAEYGYSSSTYRPKAIFECDCGFMYSRVVPLSDEDDPFSPTFVKVIRYGDVWETRLRELWVTNVPLQSVAKELGILSQTVYKEARRLDLVFPRNERDRKSADSVKLRKTKAKSTIARQPIKPRGRHHVRIDWSAIDKDLAEKIPAIIQEMKDSKQYPEHICTGTITRKLNLRKNYIHHRRSLLPQTCSLINQHSESIAEWAARRILWAIRHLPNAGKRPLVSRLLISARVSKSFHTDPIILEAIKKAYEYFDGTRE